MSELNMSKVHYSAGYKYQTKHPFIVRTPFRYEKVIHFGLITLHPNGVLYIDPNFAWDGMSGPAVDTKRTKRASLTHDALYKLIRQGLLPPEAKQVADDLFYQIMVEDKVFPPYRWIAWKAVTRFGHSSTDPANRKKVHIAP